MGLVVCAEHLTLRERVALKLLLPSAAGDRRFVKRFRREAEMMAKLRGEHTVHIHDVGVLEDGRPFIAMEYLVGRDLRAAARAERPLPIDAAIGWILQACEGVAEAHARGIVHRDLKPTNLFLTERSDGSPLVKVLDFGVSKAPTLDDETSQILTGTSAMLGSPRYMSPEQLRTPHEVDARTDVWALAAILHELIAEEPPFSGSTGAALCASIVGDPPAPVRRGRPEAPAALEAALFHALTKDVAARTPSVAAFAREIVDATNAGPSARASVERITRVLAAGATTLDTLARTGKIDRPSAPRAGAVALVSLGIAAAVAGVSLFVMTPRRDAALPAAASTERSSAPLDSASAAPTETAPPAPPAASPAAPAAPPPRPTGVAHPARTGRTEATVAPPPPAPPPTPARTSPLDERH